MKPDPTLTRALVRINYSASDGYRSEVGFNSHNPKSNSPQGALLGGLEELARLTALFGLEDEALERFNAVRKRVADFKAARA